MGLTDFFSKSKNTPVDNNKTSPLLFQKRKEIEQEFRLTMKGYLLRYQQRSTPSSRLGQFWAKVKDSKSKLTSIKTQELFLDL